MSQKDRFNPPPPEFVDRVRAFILEGQPEKNYSMRDLMVVTGRSPKPSQRLGRLIRTRLEEKGMGGSPIYSAVAIPPDLFVSLCNEIWPVKKDLSEAGKKKGQKEPLPESGQVFPDATFTDEDAFISMELFNGFGFEEILKRHHVAFTAEMISEVYVARAAITRRFTAENKEKPNPREYLLVVCAKLIQLSQTNKEVAGSPEARKILSLFQGINEEERDSCIEELYQGCRAYLNSLS